MLAHVTARESRVKLGQALMLVLTASIAEFILFPWCWLREMTTAGFLIPNLCLAAGAVQLAWQSEVLPRLPAE